MSKTRAQAVKLKVAHTLARGVLRFPPLESALRGVYRRPALRARLRLDAVALAYASVLDGQELRVADLEGYRMLVNVAEYLGIRPYFFKESGTAWVTSALVREGDTCVDAGANVGHYTFFLGAKVGPTGKVIAFEANPAYAELLRRSVDLNAWGARVLVEEKALWSASNERLKFYLSTNANNSGTSSLVQHGWYLSEDNAITVETLTLSDYVAAASIDELALVKLDVERAEAQVLEGMRPLLVEGRVHALIVEMHAGAESEALLGELGYEGWLINEAAQALIPLKAVSAGHFGDFLFLRRRDERRLAALRSHQRARAHA